MVSYTTEPAYDPYIPRSNTPMAHGDPFGSHAAGSGDNRTAALQASINDTVQTMQNNIQMAARRGDHLNDLEGKSHELADSSARFHKGSKQVRKRMWWKNKKMGCCLVLGIVILLVVIIVPSVVVGKRHHDENKDSSTGN